MHDQRDRITRLPLRLYTPQDHAYLRGWCRKRGMHPPPPEALPKLGAVALDTGETPVAMAWLYMDNSTGMALLAWTTTAPKLSPKKAAAAVDSLAEFLTGQAARFGYGWVMALGSGGLERRLCRQGFLRNHSNIHQLFKKNY